MRWKRLVSRLVISLLLAGVLTGCGGYGPKASVRQDKDRPVPASKNATADQ